MECQFHGGFTITTESCNKYYSDGEQISEEIQNQYVSKMRWLPYKSLGKENGMLLGIRVDGVEIEKEDTNKIDKVIIGIYDKSLTKRGEYRALVGMDMM